MFTIKISRTGKDEDLKKVLEDYKKRHKETFEKYLLGLDLIRQHQEEIEGLKALNEKSLSTGIALIIDKNNLEEKLKYIKASLEEERRAHNAMATEAFNNIFYRQEEALKVEELKATMKELLSILEGDSYYKVCLCKEKIKEVLDNEDDLC